MKNIKKTHHKSKLLDEWTRLAEQASSNWFDHHFVDIAVDSTEWGENQTYETSAYPFVCTDKWIDEKIKELQAAGHIYNATITLYRRLYTYNLRRHMYEPHIIKYMTICLN